MGEKDEKERMEGIGWGIIGAGDVCEVKSGPGPADHVRLQGRRVAVRNGPAFAAAGGDGAQGVGRIDRRGGREQGLLRG